MPGLDGEQGEDGFFAISEAATISVANESTDTTCFLAFFTAATGNLGPKTNANLTYNSNTGAVSVTGAIAVSWGNAGGSIPLQSLNTANAASVGVATFGGTRDSPANNDEGYVRFILNNGVSSSTEFGRITWVATDVTSTSEDARLSFSVVIAGALTEKLRLEGSALTPAANDGTALGTTSLMWSDLFVASGAVINFNNGNVTLTHSSNALNITGATSSIFGAAQNQIVTNVGGTGTGLDLTFTNDIINGTGEVFQRCRQDATSLTVTDDTYANDRWNVLTQTGSIAAASPVTGNRAYYAIKLTQSQAVAQRFGIEQILESTASVPARSRSKSFSFAVKISNSQAVRWALLEWTGTSNVVTSDVVNDWTSGTYTAGNFFLAANLTVALTDHTTPAADTWTTVTGTASISSSCNNLILFVWTEGTAAQNVNLYLSEVVMCDGTVIPTWMPRASADEWNLCQRYCYAITIPSATQHKVAQGYQVSTGILDFNFQFPTTMRAEPTLTHNISAWSSSNPTGTQAAAQDSATSSLLTITGALTVASFNPAATQSGVRFTAATSFSGTAGDPVDLRLGPSVVLYFDAEM